MANTYHQIYLQTVFAVKYRKAVIDKAWSSQLYSVIGNLINETGCKTIIVNGVGRPCTLYDWIKAGGFSFRTYENSKSKIFKIHQRPFFNIKEV